MIGPHEGKELELMLAGEKHFALFYDVLTQPFINNEEIIPEDKFAPYVIQNILLRHQRDFVYKKDNMTLRYVCFTALQEDWRAQAFFWAHENAISGKKRFDIHYEYFVGRLLGYDDKDIEEYVLQFTS